MILIKIYSINQLVFLMEAFSVLCEMQSESWYACDVHEFGLQRDYRSKNRNICCYLFLTSYIKEPLAWRQFPFVNLPMCNVISATKSF